MDDLKSNTLRPPNTTELFDLNHWGHKDHKGSQCSPRLLAHQKQSGVSVQHLAGLIDLRSPRSGPTHTLPTPKFNDDMMNSIICEADLCWSPVIAAESIVFIIKPWQTYFGSTSESSDFHLSLTWSVPSHR